MSIAVSPAVTGRYVRYVVTEVTGPNYYDWDMAEMRIYGTSRAGDRPGPPHHGGRDRELLGRRPASGPSFAFDGQYNNFWHPAGATRSPSGSRPISAAPRP